MPQQRPEWTFENKLGDKITTHDATTAEKYRHHPAFTEVKAESVPWAKRRKPELEAEIAVRNAGRGDDALPTTGTIAELAKVLDADDQALADATS